MNSLAVIIPVFNSAAILPTLVHEIVRTAYNGVTLKEIILVEDGSKDESWLKICEQKEKYPTLVKGIKLKKNCGQHTALAIGLTKASSFWIATLDDDLQVHPRELNKLIKKSHSSNCQLFYGVFPIGKKSSNWKKNASRITHKILTGKYITKNRRVTSIQMISKESVTTTYRRNRFYNTLTINIYKQAKGNIKFVGIERLPIRSQGKSTYNLKKKYLLFSSLLSASPYFSILTILNLFSWLLFMYCTVFFSHLTLLQTLFLLPLFVLNTLISYPILNFLMKSKSKGLILQTLNFNDI